MMGQMFSYCKKSFRHSVEIMGKSLFQHLKINQVSFVPPWFKPVNEILISFYCQLKVNELGCNQA